MCPPQSSVGLSVVQLRELLAQVPGTFGLSNVCIPRTLLDGTPEGADLVTRDIVVADGKIADVRPAGLSEGPEAAKWLDVGGRLVFPRFVDCHTHLDKGHVLPRTSGMDGTLPTALSVVDSDRRHWQATDLRARMEFGLRSAYHYGTGSLRTHVDSIAPQDSITWQVFKELRAAWRGRIALQGACLFSIDHVRDTDFFARICARVAEASGILGAVVFPLPDLDALLDTMFRAAMDLGLDLDFHADETGDPSANALERIAAAALRHRFAGRVLVGHCCALSMQQPKTVARTLELVAKAGLSVVALPMCNLFLQDRSSGTTPTWRGITRVHEMTAHGIPVSLGSDNTRDPFHAYGDLDMLESYRLGTRVAQLDHPLGAWPRSVTSTPAKAMGLAEAGRIATGCPADLVIFEGRTFSELLARAESRRIVLNWGRIVEEPLPDYADLDALSGMSQADAPTS